jgi:hypothetical protein
MPGPCAGRTIASMASPPLSRGRKIAVWTLIVLASVICLLSIITTWVDRQMFDNRSWNRATTSIIQDSEVQAALSTYLVNQLYDNVDVANALEQRLPPNLKALGAPLAGALRDPATRGVAFLFTRPRIQQLVVNASSIAHEKLVNVLENRTGHGISTGGGVVTLDLHQLVLEVGTSLGLPRSALDALPRTAGTVTLMRSDQLSTVQTAVRLLHALSVWLLVLVLVMYAGAIYLARGARRPVLRNVGWALVLVGLLTLVIRRIAGNEIVAALASPGYTTATHHLWLIGTEILGQIGAATIFYGAVTTLGAMLAGPTTAAIAIRRRVAPILNGRQDVVWGAAAAVYLLLILWGPTHALRTWWGILLLAALLAAGIAVLRRQTLREFPIGGTPQPETVHPTAEEQLATLRELHERGAIGDEQYEDAKKLVLT